MIYRLDMYPHKILCNARHWVTMQGSHVLVDGEGNVVSGAGGKLKGRQFKLIRSKSKDQQKYLPAPKSESKKAEPKKEKNQSPERKKEISGNIQKVKDLLAEKTKNSKANINEVTLENIKDGMKNLSNFYGSKISEKSKEFHKTIDEILHSRFGYNEETKFKDEKDALDQLTNHPERFPPLSRNYMINIAFKLAQEKKQLEDEKKMFDDFGENASQSDIEDLKSRFEENNKAIEKKEKKETELKKVAQKKADAKNNVLKKYGSGRWNGKVYGRKGNYSIYLSGDKKTISDDEAQTLNNSAPHRVFKIKMPDN